jgi:hypothetical protein
MRARLDLLICFAMAAAGCTRDNPAFDEPSETSGGSDTLDQRFDLPSDTNDTDDTNEESPAMCELAGGVDMDIEVPQPCGETDDALGLYEHYFHVVEAAGSTWSVQFCPDQTCIDCEPVVADLVLAPLSVAEIAPPGACLLMRGRRLGAGDDCNYHAVSIQDMSNGGAMLVLARRTELLDLPPIDTNTGLLGWEPTLVVDETCDCAATPDACCDGQAPTLYAYQVNGPTPVPVGSVATVTLGQRSYDFWAFDAFQSGDCGAPIDVSWALVAN